MSLAQYAENSAGAGKCGRLPEPKETNAKEVIKRGSQVIQTLTHLRTVVQNARRNRRGSSPSGPKRCHRCNAYGDKTYHHAQPESLVDSKCQLRYTAESYFPSITREKFESQVVWNSAIQEVNVAICVSSTVSRLAERETRRQGGAQHVTQPHFTERGNLNTSHI